MRAGFGLVRNATPEYLRFAAQFGATDISINLNRADLSSAGGRWELQELVKLRQSVEMFGLKLSALENVPTDFYDHIMLGGGQARRTDRKYDLHGPQHCAGRDTNLWLQLDAN